MNTNRFLTRFAENRIKSFISNVKVLNCVELKKLLDNKTNEIQQIKKEYCDYDEYELNNVSQEYDIIKNFMKYKKCISQKENDISQTILSEQFSMNHFNKNKF